MNGTGRPVTAAERPRPILPPPVPPGGVIGVVAPAGPFPPERFKKGLDRLAALGFQTRSPSQIFDRTGYLAGGDTARAATFNQLLAREDLHAVMAARGGYGALRVLDRIDVARLIEKPRLLIGFSDVTALLLDLHRRTGLVTVHGPMVASLAEADPASAEHLRGLLTGQPVFPVSPGNLRPIHSGRAEGPLWGGNLTLIVHLLALGRLPDPRGAVLFLEDVDEAPYRLDRHLTTLKLAGIFEACAGVLLGDFKNCGPDDRVDELLKDIFKGFPGPVVAGFPLGHNARNLALPIGPRAVLDADQGSLDVLEPYLAEGAPSSGTRP